LDERKKSEKLPFKCRGEWFTMLKGTSITSLMENRGKL
jgi:hypothetical protein